MFQLLKWASIKGTNMLPIFFPKEYPLWEYNITLRDIELGNHQN